MHISNLNAEIFTRTRQSLALSTWRNPLGLLCLVTVAKPRLDQPFQGRSVPSIIYDKTVGKQLKNWHKAVTVQGKLAHSVFKQCSHLSRIMELSPLCQQKLIASLFCLDLDHLNAQSHHFHSSNGNALAGSLHFLTTLSN